MRKNVWFILALVLILPAMFFMVSCGGKEVVSQPEATAPQPEPEPEEPAPSGPSPEEQAAAEAARALAAAKSQFQNENVYFEFDSAALLPSAQATLSSKADLLNMHADINVTIGGHCDERGTDAYNMALGQRRADAARDYLINLGVSSNQLNTISYGEEEPSDWGHDEAAWSKNRRAEFRIDY